MEKIIEIKALKNYKLFLKYSDGVEGVIDLSDIVGKGVFEAFKNYSFFENVKIGESDAPTWENETDIDPLNQYLKLTGKTVEQYLADKKNRNVAYWL